MSPVGHGEAAEHFPVALLKMEPAGHIGGSEHFPAVLLKDVGHTGKDPHFLEVELYDNPTSHNGAVLQDVDTRFVPSGHI